MLIHDLLGRAARLWPSRTATVDGGVVRSYAETAARVRRLAGALDRLCEGRDRHVAILARNSHRFMESYFACSLAGCVAVPLNVRLAAPELEFMIEDARASVLLGDEELLAAVPGPITRVSFDGPLAGAHAYEDLLADGPAPGDGFPRPDDAALAHLCYTGGTTGKPKGVMLSHRNVVASALNKIHLGGFRGDDVWLHAAPLFHQADSWAAFSFTALGARHVFAPRFEARAIAELIREHAVTATQIVPTMLFMLMEGDDPDAGFPSLRRVLYGSAPMPLSRLREAISVFGPVFQHIYGQTESAGTMTATDPHELQALVESGDERLASCGREILGVELKVVDAAGDAVEAGTVGRILVRGPTVMTGYWGRPEATAEVLRDGWLDTGDLGRLDGGGYLYIVDRARDVIITGGENVYSTEVEDVLGSHPAVAEVAVIGVPDERWGEAVTAFVVLRPGAAASSVELLDHARSRMARYKCPKTIEVVDALPRSAAGKILKSALRAGRGGRSGAA